ncbi:hypothetical protein FDP41_000007 [Naegleria fowleri]|uniref:Uncharacterized protein n=1 Tax=Naegleria fowleri TaxID=5763 RepID=A0A6A5CIA8_NAEFO|nr:uncharacterized protein FDP41_000007 [Naegleria fowleri]KAF0984968.1 hypothetical protein FDP41_000007 [Naegleria fowleri]CAG4711081.1 unnamed protein product [Naegleria fowleri]
MPRGRKPSSNNKRKKVEEEDIKKTDGQQNDHDDNTSSVPIYKKKASGGSVRGVRKTIAPLTKEEKKEQDYKRYQETKQAIAEARRKKRKTGSDEGTVVPKPRVEEVENLWQGWKEVFLVGTEWSGYDMAYKFEWDFEHLHDFLFYDEDVAKQASKENESTSTDDDEELKPPAHVLEKGKNCFVFGSTEPQLVNGEMVYIPVMIAVVSDLAPPTKLGIKSVQMVNEEIIDMKKLKMSWTPFIPKANQSKRINYANLPHVFALHCNLRRNQLSRMKEEDVKVYEYCLPYCFRPSRVIDEIKKDNSGSIEMLYVLDKSGSVQFSFDPEEDDINTIVEEVCEDNDLDPEQYTSKLKEFIKAEMKKFKESVQKKVEEKQAEIDKLSEQERKSLNEMKVYKFYPQNKSPDLSPFKVAYVNRYYGKADVLL